MFVYIAPDGQVKVLENEADLKTPYKWNGWQGRAFKLSLGSEVDLTVHKPKPKPGTAPVVQVQGVAPEVLAQIVNAAVEAALAKEREKNAPKPDPALKA